VRQYQLPTCKITDGGKEGLERRVVVSGTHILIQMAETQKERHYDQFEILSDIKVYVEDNMQY
jgi:hypothetical protein